MKKKIVSIQYLLLLALAGLLLYFSFRGVKWNDFMEGLEGCNFYWIAASVLVGISGFIFRGLRWRLLMLPLNKDVTSKEAYDGVAIAYLTNFAFPRAGEVARCGVMAKTRKVTFEGALGTVVLERGFDMLCLLFWIFVLLLFKWNEFGGFLKNQLFAPIQEKFSSSFVWLAVGAVAFICLCCALVWIFRKRLLEIKLFAKVANLAKGLAQGLLAAFKMEHKWLFFLYTAALWGTYWLTSYTTIMAFPSVGHLNGTDALFLMIVGGLGWVVPVQGGLGAYHFIVSLALWSIYSIPQTSGVVFATISHESQALAMILCGAISLVSVSMGGKKQKTS